MNDLLNNGSLPAYELEMDMPETETYFETDEEFELAEDQEMEGYEENAELESILEGEADDFESADYEWESIPIDQFTGRLFELSQFEYESEELDRELESVLNDMEREYFWAALAPAVLNAAKNPAVRSFAKKFGLKALQGIKKRLSGGAALKAGTSLLRGNLKGNFLPMFRTVIQSISPQADPGILAAAAPLGIEAGQNADEQNAALQGLVETAQEAYEFAAGNLHENIDQPLEATRLANRAFEVGFSRRPTPPRWQDHRRPMPVAHQPGTRVVRLTQRPGEQIRRIVVLIN